MELDTKKINNYLNSNKFDFKIFSIKYNKIMKEVINCLDIKNDSIFKHFGSIKEMQNLNLFLSELGNNTLNDIKQIEKIIISIIKKVLKGYKKTHFWIDIRVTLPNSNFDIPRWHKDGTFFSTETHSSKFVTVLKGPGTLLIKGTKKINQIYNEILIEKRKEINKNQQLIENKYRPIIAAKLANEKIVKLKNTQGVIFFAGNPNDIAALHSEPPIDTPRLFISILPSTETNIKELKQRWIK
jgi:hypothetical protein